MKKVFVNKRTKRLLKTKSLTGFIPLVLTTLGNLFLYIIKKVKLFTPIKNKIVNKIVIVKAKRKRKNIINQVD